MVAVLEDRFEDIPVEHHHIGSEEVAVSAAGLVDGDTSDLLSVEVDHIPGGIGPGGIGHIAAVDIPAAVVDDRPVPVARCTAPTVSTVVYSCLLQTRRPTQE